MHPWLSIQFADAKQPVDIQRCDQLPRGLTAGTFTGQTVSDYFAGTGTDAALGSADITAQAVPTAAVPEASTTVSFGLLLVLGMGGIMAAGRRKKWMG